MKKIYNERMTSIIEDEFVVFLVGMRINKLWKINKWLPVLKAMPKMLKELYKNPQLGFMSCETWFGRTTVLVQYWKSFEHLDKYAKSKDSQHLPAWIEFNKLIGSSGDVGIWHETYVIKKGQYECIYHNMPKFGLGKAGALIPVKGKLNSARDRLG